MAFGGAGPLHANAMAAVLGCYPVVVPKNPGVLSALGFIQSEFKNEFVQTFIRSTIDLDRAALAAQFADPDRTRARPGWRRRGSHPPTSASSTASTCATSSRASRSRCEAGAALIRDGDPTEGIALFPSGA